MGAHPSGDGVAWDSLEVIDVDQPHGLDYRAWNHLAIGVRKRLMQEHSEFGDTTEGGIHKPGGCAVLGMEITDTAVDPTDLVVPDGTYRGHGMIWAYDDASNFGTLWCSTAAAGISTTGDWTLMKLHPSDQWGGGDVTWAGSQQFDNSVTVGADATLEILGDLSVAGYALFDGSVVLTADATLEILGDISVAGFALFDGSVVITADATLAVLGQLLADTTEILFGESAGLGLFYDPTVETGAAGSTGQTVLPNGLRIAYGSEEVEAGATDTITVAGFSAVYSVTANWSSATGTDFYHPKVHTLAANTFKITNTNATLTCYWIAIGR